MKKISGLALVLSSAAFAFPTLAHAAGKPSISENQVSGVGEFWLGYNFLSASDAAVVDDDSYPGLGGSLRVNIPAGGDTNFQLDLQSETGFVDDSNDNYTGSVLGGAHFSFRDPEKWLLGGFAGVGNGFNASADTVTAYLVGVEGQFYLQDWTLYGQVGYTDGADVNIDPDDAFGNAWFVRGVGRWFIDSNVKLEGELSFASGENDTDSDDMDVWGWGLRYERTIASMDSSFFIAYQGNYYDSTDPNSAPDTNKLTEHVVKLGLNFAFGIEGQKYIDRHGATLDLPMVTRWSAYGADVLD